MNKRLLVLGQIIGIFTLFQLISLFVGYILIGVNPNTMSYNSKLLISFFCAQILLFIASVILIKLWSISYDFKIKPFSFKVFRAVVLIGLSTYFLYEIFDIVFLFKKAFKGVLAFHEFIQKPISGISHFVFELLVTVVLGPLIEEILYRKVIFTKLKTFFSLRISIIITSVLFSFMHLDFDGLIHYFIIGVLLTYTYHLTKSLALNVIYHALLNLLTFFTIKSDIPFTDRSILMCILFYIVCFTCLFQGLKFLKSQNL